MLTGGETRGVECVSLWFEGVFRTALDPGLDGLLLCLLLVVLFELEMDFVDLELETVLTEDAERIEVLDFCFSLVFFLAEPSILPKTGC